LSIIRRGFQRIDCRYNSQNFNFVVYCDGTAEVPIRNQPLLAKLRVQNKKTKRIGLKNLGELLHNLTTEKDKYSYSPILLDGMQDEDIMELTAALKSAEDFVKRTKGPITDL
jgi:hypothetical protein